MGVSKWAMLLEGTVLRTPDWHWKKQPDVIVSAEDAALRWRIEKEYNSTTHQEDWHVSYDGHQYRLDDQRGFKEVKLPSPSKEFLAAAVKGSEWEFERDWTFNGWTGYPSIDFWFAKRQPGELPVDRRVFTVPAGTKLVITNTKMRMDNGKCIVAKQTPGLEVFCDLRGEAALVPVECWTYLKQVGAGKTRTYWCVEDQDGKKFSVKRFADIGKVKASLRVKFNLIRPKDDDEYIPEWVDGTYGIHDKPKVDNGVFAVQYDYMTNAEIYREDMSSYLIMAHLKA